MGKKKRKIKKSIFSPAIFFSFILIALFLIFLLEYIEYNHSGNSYLFTKLLGNKKPETYAFKFNRNLFELLGKGDYLFDYYKDIKGNFHFKIDVSKKRFKELDKKIKYIAKNNGFKLIPVEVKREKQKTTYLFKTVHNNLSYHYLLLTKTEKKSVARKITIKKTGPRIAFLIDDLGAHSLGALELKKLGIPVTASVLPFSPRGFEEAKWIHEYGLEELIHLPMQPKKDQFNGHTLKNTIMIDSDEKYIEELISRAEKLVPFAKGINNHQGSLVTSNRKIMIKILSVVKSKRMFFIDSKTDFDSVAFSIAKKIGVKTAKRDVFLDHIQNYDHSVYQIKRLIKIAKKNGTAIAIGHPFRSTLNAIRDMIPFIKSQKVNIVFVKELLE